MAGSNDRHGASGAAFKDLAEFMADVVHNLKTPLNAIIGFGSVLLQESEGFDPEKIRQLGLVYRSARQLLERLDALVEYFRMGAGLIRTDREWFAPRQLILTALSPFGESAREQGLCLQIGSAHSPSRIRASSRLVLRVLQELISNAVQLTEQGEVTVEATAGSGARPDTKTVRFSVADSGSGLSPEKLQNLSCMLGPEASPNRDAYQGLGLGLALSRTAASLLGGWIQVENNTPKGSKFTLVVELPEGDVRE